MSLKNTKSDGQEQYNMDVLEELNNLTIWDASTLKNKKEIENVIDALTQAQYNYNREDVGMSAEDLATIFGKEKATKLEKNYQESYEQNYGRSPK
jgi:hypothetical protein